MQLKYSCIFTYEYFNEHANVMNSRVATVHLRLHYLAQWYFVEKSLKHILPWILVTHWKINEVYTNLQSNTATMLETKLTGFWKLNKFDSWKSQFM
jgi:hypothetical protein